MKNILFRILLFTTIVQNSFGQYHKFNKAVGFAVSPAASITSIATAGGGVVLKGIAKPKFPDSLYVFKNITFAEAKMVSTMFIQTEKMNLSYSD